MKLCPKHKVQIHQYTTFEFCPECEKEPSQVQESFAKAKEADVVISMEKQGYVPCPTGYGFIANTRPKASPRCHPTVKYICDSTGNAENLLAIIQTDRRYSSSSQWSHLYNSIEQVVKDTMDITEKGTWEVAEVNTVPQPVEWHPAYGMSRRMWTVWSQGSTVLSASAKKVEIVQSILIHTV